jgi:hypothetical protein
MSSQTFPGLQPFILNEAQRIGIEAEFALVLSDARLVGRSKDDIRHAIPKIYDDVPGIYFWIMGIGPHLYRIYVGKTKSLERRVADYMKDFQAHSPNDYKIRIFQQAICEKEPSAGFRLYFERASLDTYTSLETQAVQRYDPLLNRRASVSPAAREAFKNAFEAFYRAGFEAVLA